MPSAAHTKASPTSDHERGEAVDLTNDPEHGVRCAEIAEQLKTDPRVKYLIFNRRIFKARTGKWEPYTGKNPHTSHLHTSIHSYARDDLSPWPFSPNGAAPAPVTPRTLKVTNPMMTGEDVLKVQMRLGMKGYTISADATYGKVTESVVMQFQKNEGLEVDGKVGPATRKALGITKGDER